MATITVTTFDDELDADTSDAGDLSLREALQAARESEGADVIVFAGSGTILLDPTLGGRGGNVFVDTDVSIDGGGDVVIDGGDRTRIFYIDAGAEVSLTGLTLQNGLAKGGDGTGAFSGGGGGGLGAGGAVFLASGGSLFLGDVSFGSNEAQGGDGGAGNVNESYAGPGGRGAGGPAFTSGEFGRGGDGGYFGTPDDGSEPGASGGFGAGGGGGGGGYLGYVADSDDPVSRSPAEGGNGGYGAGSGGGGSYGYRPEGPFAGGRGGGGAGLGGSIFVQAGGALTIGGGVVDTTGQATGGAGASNGQGLGDGLFLQDASVLVDVATGEVTTLAGVTSDQGVSSRIVKTGAGQLILSGEISNEQGVRMQGGEVHLDGATVSRDVSVSDGRLTGSGRVGGIFFGQNGVVAPDGLITTNFLSFSDNPGSALEIGAETTAGEVVVSALSVSGVVRLTGGGLVTTFNPSLDIATDDTFVMIANGGVDAVVGTFNGLAEGAFITQGGYRFQISYVGGDGNDVALTAQAFANVVTGDEEANRLSGTDGPDRISGAGGNDRVIASKGPDALDGGAGVDELDLYKLASGVSLFLSRTTEQTLYEGLNQTISGFESVSGSVFSDSLVGNGQANLLRGGGGDDTLSGSSGDDRLDGGTGDDSLLGGSDADRLTGADGDDVLDGLTGADLLDGGAGSDSLRGGSGVDTLLGGDGGDTLDGGFGADIFRGGAGADFYNVDDARDLIQSEAAGPETDVVSTTIDFSLAGIANVENLATFSNAGLTLTGNTLDNFIQGGGGADDLNGATGADSLLGGAGADVLRAGVDADADVFIFTPGDSTAARAGRDTVLQFVSGQDRIDFTQLDVDDFASDIRITQKNGVTLVLVDLDDDGQFDDFGLQFNGATPVEGDFIL